MIVGNEETLVNVWYEWLLRENTDRMTRPFQDNRHVLDPCTLDHDTAVLTAVVLFCAPGDMSGKFFFYLMDRETNYKCTSCTAAFWILFLLLPSTTSFSFSASSHGLCQEPRLFAANAFWLSFIPNL